MLDRGHDLAGTQRVNITLRDQIGAFFWKYLVRRFSDQISAGFAGQLFIGPIEQSKSAVGAVRIQSRDVLHNNRHGNVLDHRIEKILCAAQFVFGQRDFGNIMGNRQSRRPGPIAQCA